jgi:hypothetical protein
MFFLGCLHFLGIHVSHGVRAGSIPAHEEKDPEVHDGKDQVSLLTRARVFLTQNIVSKPIFFIHGTHVNWSHFGAHQG